jgi:PAS domain-containing protein
MAIAQRRAVVPTMSAPLRLLPPPRELAADAPADLFTTVFRDSPDGMLIVEAASGVVLDVNRAVRGLLGYEPAWLIGRPVVTLFDAPLAERTRQHGHVV